MVSRRQERIADLLREELSLLISSELTDPRLEEAMLNVTDVRVSADLHTAHVYVEHALGEEKSRHILSALANAQSFLRRALVENLDLRFVPDLFFHVDMTERRAQHIDALLNTISETSRPEADGPSANQEDHADASESIGSQSDHVGQPDDQGQPATSGADRDAG
jgi:ribosome-binding factor A